MRHGLTMGELARLSSPRAASTPTSKSSGCAAGGGGCSSPTPGSPGCRRARTCRRPTRRSTTPGRCCSRGPCSPRGGAPPGPSSSAAPPGSIPRPTAPCAAPARAAFREGLVPADVPEVGRAGLRRRCRSTSPTRAYRPYRTTLAILAEIRRLGRSDLWRQPPYEYETGACRSTC
jgi:hypothetical protein